MDDNQLFFDSIQNGDNATVQRLIKELPGFVTARGWRTYKNSLQVACAYNNSECVKILLENGVCFNMSLFSRELDEIETIAQNDHDKCLKEIIKFWPEVLEHKDTQGYLVVLRNCSLHNSKKCLELLAELGCDLDVRHGNHDGGKGWTTAMMSAFNENMVAFRTLVDLGANVLLKTENGKDTLDLLYVFEHTAKDRRIVAQAMVGQMKTEEEIGNFIAKHDLRMQDLIGE